MVRRSVPVISCEIKSKGCRMTAGVSSRGLAAVNSVGGGRQQKSIALSGVLPGGWCDYTSVLRLRIAHVAREVPDAGRPKGRSRTRVTGRLFVSEHHHGSKVATRTATICVSSAHRQAL